MRLLEADEWRALERIAEATAGERATPVLLDLAGRVYVSPYTQRSSLHFDERTLRIDRMVLAGNACAFTVAHEFGHAYHCHYWPVISALMAVSDDRAEAVAILFELQLQERSVVDPEVWAERDAVLVGKENSKPFDILSRVLQTEATDFHALVGRIIDGA